MSGFYGNFRVNRFIGVSIAGAHTCDIRTPHALANVTHNSFGSTKPNHILENGQLSTRSSVPVCVCVCFDTLPLDWSSLLLCAANDIDTIRSAHAPINTSTSIVEQSMGVCLCWRVACVMLQ